MNADQHGWKAERSSSARQEVETLAAQIDWSRAPKTLRPPQEWFDDTDNPFEPDEQPPADASGS